MQFFNRLFGGGSRAATNNSAGKLAGDDAGLYYYVQDNATSEVMRIRVNRNNDLSADDDNGGFFVRKMLTGSRGYNRVEVKLSYDSRRNFTGAEVDGGKMVDEDAYHTYLSNSTTP